MHETTRTRRATSLEFERVTVTADVELDGAVQIGFERGGTTSWHTAAWEGDPATTRVARVLVGPGGTLDLAKGDHLVLVKLTDVPEIPELEAYWLTIK